MLIAAALLVAACGISAVVIDDYLNRIEVALARAHHVSSRILKHRHQERKHVALGIQVLHRLKNPGTLPLPTVFLRLEVITMALPDGDILTGQTLGRLETRIYLINKRKTVTLLVSEVVTIEKFLDVASTDGNRHVQLQAKLG